MKNSINSPNNKILLSNFMIFFAIVFLLKTQIHFFTRNIYQTLIISPSTTSRFLVIKQKLIYILSISIHVEYIYI